MATIQETVEQVKKVIELAEADGCEEALVAKEHAIISLEVLARIQTRVDTMNSLATFALEAAKSASNAPSCRDLDREANQD